jgi:hypothetical protein
MEIRQLSLTVSLMASQVVSLSHSKSPLSYNSVRETQWQLRQDKNYMRS